MHDFTANWGWPQWFILAVLTARFLFRAHMHDKPAVVLSGERKGQPGTYNAFHYLLHTTIFIAVLTAGGFFA